MFDNAANPERLDQPRNRVRGVILAGAHTWDAQALDDVTPRCLLPVALSPMICYTLRWLQNAGVRRTTICTDNVSRCVRRVLDDGSRFGMDLDYFEDWVPRGPAGCVRDATTGLDADAYVVVQSSVIPNFSLPRLLKKHFDSRATLTVVLSDNRAEQADDGSLSPVGVYVFDRRAVDHVPRISYQDIKEILVPRLRDHHEPVIPFIVKHPVFRVTGVESYLATNERMVELACRSAVTNNEYRQMGESLVHATAGVCNAASLVGPVLIGAGVHVAPDAAVVGPCAIGVGSRVGNGALVSRSVVWEDCEIGECSHVFRSVAPGGTVVRNAARVRHCLLTPDQRVSPGAGRSGEQPPDNRSPIPAGNDVCNDCNCSAASSVSAELQTPAASGEQR